MAKNTASISNDFNGRLRSLEYTRKKLASLFLDGLVTRRDLEQVYQGLFLEAVAVFESCIEQLFMGLLTNQITAYSNRSLPKVNFLSRATAWPIVVGGRFYDWLPYSRTIEHAKCFFKDGHPFTALDNNEVEKTEEFRIIRNVIAHRSDYAKKQFEAKVIGSTALSPREKKVGAYLSGNFRLSPPQTRYENLVINMASIFEKICSV